MSRADRESGGSQEALVALREREADLLHKLEAFQKIGVAFASSLNLGPLLDAIVEHVTQLLDAERCTLYILDRNSRKLWCSLPPEAGGGEFRVSLGEGIVGLVAETSRSVNLKDAHQDPRFDPSYEEKTGFRTTSLLCVPLVDYRQRITGVVEVLNKRCGYFSVEDQQILEAVAAQAAMSISNSKMYLDAVGKNLEIQDAQERLRAKMEELDILYRIEQEMNRTDDLDTLLAQIVRHAVSTIPAQVGAVALSESEQEVVTLFWSNEEAAQQLRVPAGEGVVGQVARHGRTVVANDLEVGSELKGIVAKRLRREPRSVLCVPLSIKGASAGALAMYNKTGGRSQFVAEDMKLLTLIAAQVSRAIQRARERESELRANRLATVGQLLSGVLHDYKTPMSIISGYAQLMVAEEDESEREEYAASIRKQIDMLGNMTGEILAFARGESNLLVRRVQLNKFVDEVSELLRGEFAGREVELHVEASYLGPMRMDEVKFRRGRVQPGPQRARGDAGGRGLYDGGGRRRRGRRGRVHLPGRRAGRARGDPRPSVRELRDQREEERNRSRVGDRQADRRRARGAYPLRLGARRGHDLRDPAASPGAE